MAALLNWAPVGVAMAAAEGLPCEPGVRGGEGVRGATLCLFLMGSRGGCPRFLAMSNRHDWSCFGTTGRDSRPHFARNTC